MDISSALLHSSIEYKTLLKERLKTAKNGNSDKDTGITFNKEENEIKPQLVHSWRRHLDHNLNRVSTSKESPSYHNDLVSKLDNMTFNDKKTTSKINNNDSINWYKEFREKEYDASSWNLSLDTDDKILNENNNSKSPLRSPNTKSPIKLFQNSSYSPKRDLNRSNSSKSELLEAAKIFDNILIKRYFQLLKSKAQDKRNVRNKAFDRLIQIKKKLFFRNWCNIYYASILSKKVKQGKLWKCLCIWNQNSLKSKRLSDAMYNYAEHHYRTRSGKILISRIKSLIVIKKIKRDKKQKINTALNYRYEKLLKNCLLAWKYQAKKLMKEKQSKEEHVQRLERIKKLVSNIGNSKNTITSSKTTINNGKNEDISMHLSCSKEERLIHDQNEDKSTKQDEKLIDNNLHDNFECETEFRSNEKDILFAEEKESKVSPRESKSNRSIRTTPDKKITQKQPTPNIEKPKNYPSKEELEMRAIDRKKRVVGLRKQAEERVAKRLKEEESAKSSKLQVEDEALNKMREERKTKLEKEKAMSVRSKEMQLENQRKFEIATKFYNTQLILRLGFAPWCRLIEIKKMNSLKAFNFRDDFLLQSSWIAFYGYVMMLKNERVRREYRASAFAVAHFRRSLIKKTWKCWSLYRKLLKAKAKAVTGHFSRYCIVRRAYKAWRLTLERVRRKSTLQYRAVESRGNKCVIKFYWTRWYEFLQQSFIEREINNRADLTWNKVQKWLS